MWALRTVVARAVLSRPSQMRLRWPMANARLLSDAKQASSVHIEALSDKKDSNEMSKDLVKNLFDTDKRSAVVQSIPELEAILSEVSSPGQALPGELATRVIVRAAGFLATKPESDSGAMLYELKSDPRFEDALAVLQSNAVNTASTGSILAALRALSSMGLPPDHFCAQSLLNALLFRTRTMTVHSLVNTLAFSAPRRGDTVQHNRLFAEACATLERRWVEVVDPATFVVILHNADCFSERFLNKVDDRLTESVGAMTYPVMVTILGKLGERKRRSLPLLKALAFHLTRDSDKLSIKQASDCLYALRELSFKQVDLLDAICRSLKFHDVESASVVRSILTNLGQLKFLHRPLMDDAAAWMSSRAASLSSRDLVAFLMSTAALSYKPKNADKVYQRILSDISLDSLREASPSKSKSELLWLDVVWSLAALEMHTSKHLASVLTLDFYNKLLHNHDSRNVGAILKILNLNAVAKYCTANYQGPTINVKEDFLLREVSSTDRSDRLALVKSVVESFSALASPPSFLATKVNTGMGFNVDAECVISIDKGVMTPLSLESHGTGPSSSQLPKGAHRVALLVTSFSESLLSGSPSGLSVLYRRLLNAAGYKVLHVSHTEFSTRITKVDRIKLLEKKLRSLLER